MKRLLADVLLVIILVSIGSYMNDQDQFSAKEQLHAQVQEFEDEVAQHEITQSKTGSASFPDLKENNASRLAQSGSDVVINVIHGTVGMLSEIFHNMIQY